MLPQVEIKPAVIDWTGLPKRYMNPGELETLVALIGSVSPRVVVEFGINTGRTAKAILREVLGIEQYIGYDVMPGYVTEKKVQRKEVPALAGEMVKDDPRVTVWVSKNGSHDFDRIPPCDVVFIDGDHSRAGVEHDTQLARAAVRSGGLIIWHDYHDLGTVDVREVLDEMAGDIQHVKGTWIAFERVK